MGDDGSEVGVLVVGGVEGAHLVGVAGEALEEGVV